MFKRYNPFDFKSYEEQYNPYGFDKIYTKFTRKSTPYSRLKIFLNDIFIKIKSMFKNKYKK
jgi:hypothetical protein